MGNPPNSTVGREYEDRAGMRTQGIEVGGNTGLRGQRKWRLHESGIMVTMDRCRQGQGKQDGQLSRNHAYLFLQVKYGENFEWVVR